MKKRLEADLISIAHRILQLKNKSDINQLYLETQKLQEKLAVLRFMENHFGDVKPTIGRVEIEKEIETAFDALALLELEKATPVEEIIIAERIETPLEQVEIIAQVETEEDETEAIDSEEEFEAEVENEEDGDFNETEEEMEYQDEVEEENEIEPEASKRVVTAFEPTFNLSEDTEDLEVETPKKAEAVQISFEDLLGGNYSETLFVKVDQAEEKPMKIETPEERIIEEKSIDTVPEIRIEPEPKIVSLNEKLSKGIDIDLNDRIAFVKHLFGNDNEDYNRVMNQLITFDTYRETRDFIEDMVKPDYNNWEGKDDYAERFMEIVEKKFL
jgi:hypothetical protein